MEALAEAGQIVLSAATAALLDPRLVGAARTGRLPAAGRRPAVAA